MIKIFTDGSSRGNPGPGGWGAIVQIESEKSKMKNGGAATRELGGRENSTTNNRMELKAAIEALRYVKTLNIGSDETVEINSDSEYVVKGMTQWIYGWKRKGWTGSAKKPVMNRDLWEDLDLAASGLNVRWNHVAGHSGHAENERCDKIATDFADGKEIELQE